MLNIGIDLGGTNIAAGLVDEQGNIIKKLIKPTDKQRRYEAIVKTIADLCQELITYTICENKNVSSIGIGSPGVLDNSKGELVYACTFPDFNNVPIASDLRKYLDIPVFLQNDANCAALAESIAGASKDTKNSITITLGTGVGGGVIINRQVYEGFNHAAGELGHMVICIDGEECSCKRKGCWEAYASATALIGQTKRAAQNNPNSIINELVNGDLDNITAKTVFDAAKADDSAAASVVDNYIAYVAEGLINLINIFMPEIIVVSGGVSNQGEYLLVPLRQKVEQYVYGSDFLPLTRVEKASMGNDAGIVGSAMYAYACNR